MTTLLQGLSQGLERRLGDIEAEKPEQEDPELEVARRQTVMKVWTLQVRAMERQRQLERVKKETEEKLVGVMEIQAVIKAEENRIQTAERIFIENKKTLKELKERLLKLKKQEVNVSKEQNVDRLIEERKILLQEVQVMQEQNTKKEQNMDELISLFYAEIAQNTRTLEGDPTLTLIKAKLEVFALEIQRDEEDAEALR